MILGAEIKTFRQCHAGDCRTFFEAGNYHGYLSQDGNTFFLYDEKNNSYKDFTRSELEAFINAVVKTTENIAPLNLFNEITASDTGKITTGLILLAALILGVLIINKKF